MKQYEELWNQSNDKIVEMLIEREMTMNEYLHELQLLHEFAAMMKTTPDIVRKLINRVDWDMTCFIGDYQRIS